MVYLCVVHMSVWCVLMCLYLCGMTVQRACGVYVSVVCVFDVCVCDVCICGVYVSVMYVSVLYMCLCVCL